MRDDCLVIFVAGAGGFSGGGMFSPSQLAYARDEFAKAWPDVPILTMDWNTPGRITERLRGKKCVAKVHSFGAHRFIHELYEADECWDVMEIIIDDGVRYSASDTLDEASITSDAFVQKFDRKPIPIPAGVGCAYSFLREGGQWIMAYPESSPIVESGPLFTNTIISGFNHGAMPMAPASLNLFAAECEAVFGPRKVLSL